jgi:anthranilate phosphoribosyltransferase
MTSTLHATDAPAPDRLPALLQKLGRREALDAEEAEAAFTEVMQGRATAVQISALLSTLRARGETAAEVAGGVRALRTAMVPVEVAHDLPIVDTCGTGGGTLTTFNISTAAALLAAAAGIRVAKHGNRSFTSRCGSADVLAELGVQIEIDAETMARIFAEAGIVFMFAPVLHPAMRHVGPVRRELGFPTVMNLLGPLTNPARVRRQLVGVADPSLLELVAGALQQLGHEHALVVHGEPGLDELSPIGRSFGFEIRDGQVRDFEIEPAALFGATGTGGELAGAEPAENAAAVRDVLAGSRTGAARHAVTLNAGAALYLAGRAGSVEDGVALADQVIEEGKGLHALERLRNATRRFAGG